MPGISSLLAKLTGLVPANVGPADDGGQKFTKSKGSGKKKAQISFKVVSIKHIGRDVTTYALNEAEDALVETVSGHRVFALQVLLESYDHGFSNTAEWYLERIFTKLSRSTSKAALRAIECSWVDVSPFVNLSAAISDDDRVFSRGARDFSFLTVVNDTDDSDDETIYWIETIDLYSNTLDGVDGEPLADALQIELEDFPPPSP